jgi:hypothetical protein
MRTTSTGSSRGSRARSGAGGKEKCVAQLILPFAELLEIIRGVKPLPHQVESLRCEGDTVHVTVNPETALPSFLKGVSPKINVALKYREFKNGILVLDLHTKVFSLSATGVVKILLSIFAFPEKEGIRIHAPSGSTEPPQIHINLQAVVDKQMAGVTIAELYLYENEVIVLANIKNFRPPRRPE